MAPSLSSAGKKQLGVHSLLFLVNIIALAFAARVNAYTEFFYVADLFPLALSIVTLVLLSVIIAANVTMQNTLISRPYFQIAFFGIMTVFWLAFNAFSTSRWKYVPMSCSSIAADYPEARTWCSNVQALKAFVWIEWLIFLLITVITLHFTFAQHNLGNKHVFETSLSHYEPNVYAQWDDTTGTSKTVPVGRDSEFLQFDSEKTFTQFPSQAAR